MVRVAGLCAGNGGKRKERKRQNGFNFQFFTLSAKLHFGKRAKPLAVSDYQMVDELQPHQFSPVIFAKSAISDSNGFIFSSFQPAARFHHCMFAASSSCRNPTDAICGLPLPRPVIWIS